MKPPKMLGLVALVVLVAMAFINASSAMAEETTLCNADENPCAELNVVTHVHESTLAGSPATQLTSLGSVTCDVLFLGDTVAGSSTPLIIEGALTFTNCKRGSENCTFTEVKGPAKISVLKEGHETAKMTFVGEVQVKCGIFFQCTYDGEGLDATAKGPLLSSETNGSTSLSEQKLYKVGGGICPSEANLDITTTPLSQTYIEKEGQMVCIFVGTNNGFYLSASGTKCGGQDKTRVGSYELALATTNTPNTHVCALVTNGFYLSASEGTNCGGQDETRAGTHELGITQ